MALGFVSTKISQKCSTGHGRNVKKLISQKTNSTTTKPTTVECERTPHEYDKKTPNFAQGLDFLRSQVATYAVLQEESESKVEKLHVLEPGGKK